MTSDLPSNAKPGQRERVMLVDDDPRLRELLKQYLEQEGFEVFEAADARAMDRVVQRHSVDLIILDLMLPGEDGLSVCRRLRAVRNGTPIIMLTAKGDEVDRIVGLELGADDYLPKPFNPRELLARMHAVLRRRPGLASAQAGVAHEVVRFGPFVFDIGQRQLQRDGQEVTLTSGEFTMLKALVRHARQPLARERLAQLAKGRELEAYDRSLDVQVSRLRKLLEDDPSKPRYIQTVWGVGYVFVPEGEL